MPDRNASSYDELPYDSVPLPQSHPDYLAAQAARAGFAAADPATARILELGCAAGGNLVPIAFYWPETHCVGVELSRVQATAAQDLVETAGATNCHIVHGDLCALSTQLGEFDYIIAHGVYSWVPPAVQDALLAACASHLAAQGMAYISFNVLPGWASRQALRATLLRAIDDNAAPMAQVAAARMRLEALAQDFHASELRRYTDLPAEVAFLREASAAYLFHEYLATHNAPESYARFCQRAARHHLVPLGDASPGLCAPLCDRGSASDDAIHIQHGARFRRTLLVRRGTLRRAPARLEDLAFHADMGCDDEIDLATKSLQTFIAPHAHRIAIADPRTKAALMVLGTVHPDSLGWGDLGAASAEVLHHYAGSGASSGLPNDFAQEWRHLMALQAVWPSRRPHSFARKPGPQPSAHRLARAQAAAGYPVTGARHRALDLDAAARKLLLMMDGRRDRDDLIRGMIDMLRAQSITAHADDVGTTTDQYLALFGRAGLIT